MKSCLVALKTVTEGLATSGELHPIQRAFVEDGAMQCGFCTAGVIFSSKALLDDNPRPRDGQVRRAIGGNLCRCTGYPKVIGAIKAAGKLMAEEAPARSERP